MQTVNFNCPFCGKLMAVGINLLGRNVRCPHCKQVVQAPATAGTVVPPPATAPAPSEPTFSFPSAPPEGQEGHESIFGEVQDDDVFGTRQPKVQMPVETPPPPPPPALRRREPDTITEQLPASNPFATAPDPTAATEPEFTPPANDWHTQRDKPQEENRDFDEASREKRPPQAATRESGGGGPLIWVLLAYGAVATAGAAYLFFNRTNPTSEPPTDGGAKPQQVISFEVIPDLFGQYDRAERKKVVRLEGMPAATQDLADDLQVPLGRTLTVGQIEVKPTRIEYRKAMRHYVKADGKPDEKPTPNDVLLLHLHIKNVSDDVTLHPTDPAFDASYDRTTKVTPYTGVVVGDKHFLGGPFLWPDPQYRRQFMEGQEDDDKPLGPKQERDYVICSVLAGPDVRKAVEQKDARPVWRVQLRRGLVPWKDDSGKERDVSATCVIGVVFSAADIR
jgi:phage FluMu protein Com